MTYKLLSVGNDAKTVKGQKKGFLTGILYMAPHTIGGGKTLCPFSTAGCRAVCLYSAGRGGFNSVQQARIRKTKWFNENPHEFMDVLTEDIRKLVASGVTQNLTPCVRLNGTTDICWEKHHLTSDGTSIMERFPEVQFYDYTKYPLSLRWDRPTNYHLTYSYSEAKHAGVWSAVWQASKVNTAAVFFTADLPETFLGRPVINGDETDLRFTDPEGVIVGLKAKGKARGSDTGFVQKGT